MAIITNHFGTMEYLTAEGITAPHGFTTRLGGVSTGVLSSLNLGMHRGDDPENVRENFRRLTAAMGTSIDQLVMTWQVHGNVVRRVGKQDANGIDHRNYPQCDALITNEPGVALWVFTADCTPILLQDPVTGAVGAIHAGWRGTALGIAAKAVEEMVAAYGCDPADNSTDHTREYVPMLTYYKGIEPENLGTLEGFDTVGKVVKAFLGV